MIAARTVGALVGPGMIKEIERGLTEAFEDFDRAVNANVEALRRIKETGRYLCPVMVHSQLLRVEQELLLERLESVTTNYHQNSRCTDVAREFLLEQLIDWATKPPGQKRQSNTYWIYGPPGIGKTSLAHSICTSLHKRKNLAGAFFCRRDDESLSEPRNILPTLIHKLARIFPLFRHLVAERLRTNPHPTPVSMNDSLLLQLILRPPRRPKRALVFVIDAFDECGNAQSRPGILKALTSAAANAPWLKIIVTSRPEVDIHRLFDTLARSSHERYDLAADKSAPSDLRNFAEIRFKSVTLERSLPSPWPEPLLFDRVISRADGQFVFIDTIVRAVEHRGDPTEHLKAALDDSSGTGLTSLYGLYSSILKARIVGGTAEFQRMIGVLLAAAPHRPLCEETIAELAGVRVDLVKIWVGDLGSLFYRDEGANGGIRVRHFSISDFFLANDCHSDYRVNLRAANVALGIACMKTMNEQLHFNICKLEDSRLMNAEIQDLPLRIKENISDALQYSCLYWSNHLCFDGGNGDEHVWESLRKFFGGPHALYWIEALSIMGMVRIGVPSLRRVVSAIVKVSTTLICNQFGLNGESNMA